MKSFKTAAKSLIALAALFCFTLQLSAQNEMTESGRIIKPTPRDGAYDREIINNRLILPYDHIREADVFWSTRIWRVLDVREMMNKHFTYPNAPFINVLLNAGVNGEATFYSVIDDRFTTPLTQEEVESLLGTRDTVCIIDPVTFLDSCYEITNDLNWADVKRFRIKEDWICDEEMGRMEVRIIGIAPLIEKYDDAGNFLFEYPMFWAYYPELRNVLARHEAFNPINDAVRMSWEDIFEMRFFASYIMKESNVHDRRIKDYKAGLDILLAADRVHQSLFNFEHDLWSY